MIAWLADRPWSNGNVGMFGTSWSGFNSLQVAMLRPPALKAICSIFASDDRYADDVHYYGGALKQLDLADWPTYMDAINVLPPDPRVAGEGWRDAWERRVAEYEPWLFGWLEHQRYDAFWKHGSLREDYGAIEAATMLVTGWADGYTNIALRGMANLTCPKRLLAGPWSHADVETSRPGPNLDLDREMARWWDRWLKGEDNGVDREPPIVAFVRRPVTPAADLEAYPGTWRFEGGWPLDRVRERGFALAGGRGGPGGRRSPTGSRSAATSGGRAWLSCAGLPPWGAGDRPAAGRGVLARLRLAARGGARDPRRPVLRARVASSAPWRTCPPGCATSTPTGPRSWSRAVCSTSRIATQGGAVAARAGTRTTCRSSWTSPRGCSSRATARAWISRGPTGRNCWPPPARSRSRSKREGSQIVLPVVEGPSPIAERPDLPRPADRRLGTPRACRGGSNGTSSGTRPGRSSGTATGAKPTTWHPRSPNASAAWWASRSTIPDARGFRRRRATSSRGPGRSSPRRCAAASRATREGYQRAPRDRRRGGRQRAVVASLRPALRPRPPVIRADRPACGARASTASRAEGRAPRGTDGRRGRRRDPARAST